MGKRGNRSLFLKNNHVNKPNSTDRYKTSGLMIKKSPGKYQLS
jgi:hypothetical protein